MEEESERTLKLKDKILRAPYEICVERARFYTQSYKETEGEHPSIRAAKALDKTLRNMTIYILDEELIVGNRSSRLVGAVLPIERGDISAIIEHDLETIEKRKIHPYRISEEEKKELLEEIIPYWRGKTVMELKRDLLFQHNLISKLEVNSKTVSEIHIPLEMIEDALSTNPEYLNLMLDLLSSETPNFISDIFDVQGHLILGHKNVIKEGFRGVKARAEKRLGELGEEDERRKFLEGVIICCDAAKAFASRFADLAEQMALKEEDDKRREELKIIAENCRWVPYNPPRNFYEAMQFLWFTQVIAYISHGAGAIFTMGRVDQYLYPFYKKDVQEGRITEQEVQVLLEELLIKTSYNLLPLFSLGKEIASELGADSQAITIGGVNREGEDATNELSYIFLEAVKKLEGLAHEVMVRVSGKTSTDFLMKIADAQSVPYGPKGFFNDDVIIPALTDSGYSLEDARDYAIIGCVEPSSDGNSFPCTAGNDISLVGVLEMALKNGELRARGRRIGPETGEASKFTSFDELMDAYKKQLEYAVDLIAQGVNLKDKIYAERFHNPFVSSTLEGCIENALDMTQGGAKYNFSSIVARGIGTVADSLAAIKKLVFDEEVLSMQELIELLDMNFEGREEMRQILINRAPKYGNDDDYVDLIARDIMGMFCDEVTKHENSIRGGIFRPGAFSFGMHVSDGWFLGATPNGRKAGDPTSNSISPSTGVESKGPTAVLRSAAKIDHKKLSDGNALNIKLPPFLLKAEDDRRKFAMLIKTYFDMGGQQVQFNIVDDKVLRDAQKHPEKYRDLVVRVSGFSAYFTDLGKPIQDEIIARATFGIFGA